MAKNNQDAGKSANLQNALSSIQKKFGEGSIMKLGDAAAMRVETTSTSVLGFDIALGGGLPKGRVIEIYGPESGGKTTLALHAVAEVQKGGGVAAFVDAEHALDPKYAADIGVDIDELLVSQPDNGEQALEIVEALVRSDSVDIIVVDSVAALVPQAEIEGEMGDAHVGRQARLMSQALRKLTAAIGRTGCTVIFINQIREKIGVMFGNPETTTGGRALRFYASQRIEVRKASTNKKDGEEVSNTVKIKVVKNKIAPPFKTAEADIFFGEGFRRESSILNLAVEHGLVEKSGAWYSYQGKKIGQGAEKTVDYLRENPDVTTTLDAKLREMLLG